MPAPPESTARTSALGLRQRFALGVAPFVALALLDWAWHPVEVPQRLYLAIHSVLTRTTSATIHVLQKHWA